MRFVEHLTDRVNGPMKFRVFLQPLMAVIVATIDGINDAKGGRPPYFWAIITNPQHRADLAKDGWKSVGKVFLFAIVLDVNYQILVLRFVYPGELILVAILLAILPYLIVRGPVSRIARMMM